MTDTSIFRFRLEIDGKIVGRFSEAAMSGRAAPGVHGAVTLKWGRVDLQRPLNEWLLQAVKNKTASRKIAVVMADDRGKDIVRWNLDNAWPLKCDPPDFNAKGNDVAVETVEIVHEGMSRAASVVTEFDFRLPAGYTDKEGRLHREGRMRLATAADEVLPLKDPRVQSNPSYKKIILMSRVITRLGGLESVTPSVVEGLYAADLAYLQDFYNRINGKGSGTVRTACPACGHSFETDDPGDGE